jgi:hypothetical protein
VSEQGKIVHHKLTQKQAGSGIDVDGRPSGEVTLVATLQYLSARQPGWVEVLTAGVPGIQVWREKEVDCGASHSNLHRCCRLASARR